MLVSLTIIRYPKKYIFFALIAMAVHRLPLFFNKKISFYKLMGSGKNGSFDIHPDWQQWAILAAFKTPADIASLTSQNMIRELYGRFISRWLSSFNCEAYTLLLNPIEGHGYWDGKQPFGQLPKKTSYEGPVAVLTRATIRVLKLRAFWKNVDGVAVRTQGAKGLNSSYGIGELPFIKQATFSVWDTKQSMQDYAYKMQEHSEVIKKTRRENWYSEEMFIRFKPLRSMGSVKGNDPLMGKF